MSSVTKPPGDLPDPAYFAEAIGDRLDDIPGLANMSIGDLQKPKPLPNIPSRVIRNRALLHFRHSNTIGRDSESDYENIGEDSVRDNEKFGLFAGSDIRA